MTLSRDVIVALALLVVFVAYGIEAQNIAVFPGQELEPFKPRTMPFALSICGALLCVIRILQTLREPTVPGDNTTGYDWKRAGSLCLVMLGYGFLFTRMGFLIATVMFLAAGFYILGERRVTALLLLPTIFSTVFWALMTQLLGLYLAPGTWWPAFAG